MAFAMGRLASWALAALLVVPALASAQNGPGGGARPRRPMTLVADVDLQIDRQMLQDISLSDENRAQINAIIDRGQSDARAAVGGYADAGPDERQRMVKAAQAAVADAQAKVEAELTAEQVATLARAVAGFEVSGSAKELAAQRTAVDALDDLDAEKKRQLLADYDAATRDMDAEVASSAKVEELRRGRRPPAEGTADDQRHAQAVEAIGRAGRLDQGHAGRDAGVTRADSPGHVSPDAREPARSPAVVVRQS
jgi:Spy/CpxP family protein refolding chaperone